MPQRSSHIQLQPRDLELLAGLFECRVMALRHVAAIYFNGHGEAAKKRVQRLRAEGYLRCGTRRENAAAVYLLTRKSYELLRLKGLLDEYPQRGWRREQRRLDVQGPSLPHELNVLDCKAAVYAAVRDREDLSLAEFAICPQRHQFRISHVAFWEQVLVKPDGFMRLRQTRQDGPSKEHNFFLEVDRSTESCHVLVQKLLSYRQYARLGRTLRSTPRAAPQQSPHPFRVLLVVRSEERRSHLMACLAALQPPMRTLVWLVTLDAFIREPLSMPGVCRRILPIAP